MAVTPAESNRGEAEAVVRQGVEVGRTDLDNGAQEDCQ
jgi:hypothetical protein